MIRFILSRLSTRPFFPSKRIIFLQTVATLATVAVWRWFLLIGSTRRDGRGNVKSGDDLAGGGVVELAWDLYVSLQAVCRSVWIQSFMSFIILATMIALCGEARAV